jgi:acylphosphatase
VSPEPVRRRVVVRGRVQGVFFRDTIRRHAREAGVSGWVRNRPDGAVEAVFEGDAGAVEEMVALSRQGPPQADVHEVECFDEEVEGASGFAVR